VVNQPTTKLNTLFIYISSNFTPYSIQKRVSKGSGNNLIAWRNATNLSEENRVHPPSTLKIKAACSSETFQQSTRLHNIISPFADLPYSYYDGEFSGFKEKNVPSMYLLPFFGP
jgi:hypothetical protein